MCYIGHNRYVLYHPKDNAKSSTSHLSLANLQCCTCSLGMRDRGSKVAMVIITHATLDREWACPTQISISSLTSTWSNDFTAIEVELVMNGHQMAHYYNLPSQLLPLLESLYPL